MQKKIKILTDHQPLTFALGTKNTNAKLKRWKLRIGEYNYELVYKPGRTNYVAGALSRLKTECNALTSSTDTIETIISESTETAETLISETTDTDFN